MLCCSQARPDVRVEVVWLDAKCLNGVLAVHAVPRELIVKVGSWFFFHVWFSLIKISYTVNASFSGVDKPFLKTQGYEVNGLKLTRQGFMRVPKGDSYEWQGSTRRLPKTPG